MRKSERRENRFAPATLACLLALPCAPARADDVTAIRCGQLLNPVDGSITRNAVIIVSGERIERAGANATIPDGARVIDLSAYTVLPGLIDSHTHILLRARACSLRRSRSRLPAAT